MLKLLNAFRRSRKSARFRTAILIIDGNEYPFEG
jgi:hypothetical protein